MSIMGERLISTSSRSSAVRLRRILKDERVEIRMVGLVELELGQADRLDAGEGGLNGVHAAADEEREEDAGQGDEEAGLGGDEGLGDTGGNDVDGLGASAGGKAGEGGEHANDGAEQAHQWSGGHEGVEEDELALDVVQDVLADFLAAVAHVLGGGSVFLGVADNFTDPPTGVFGIVDPVHPLAFTTELHIAPTQKKEHLQPERIDH